MRPIDLPESWRSRAIVIGDAFFSTEWFTNTELVTADSFKLPKRRTEWKHGRIAAKQLALSLGLAPSARNIVIERPHLIVRGSDSGLFVSISHSRGYAAAAIDSTPVGIDVERVRELRRSAAHLFLTEAESEDLRTCAVPNSMLHFWAAKEAAWKQLNGGVETLKRVPLKLEAETDEGLRFDKVETFSTGDLVVALTRPTSGAGSSRR